MKTILLLGGYGFLGTNIMKYVDSFLCEQYKFIVFDKFPKHLGGVEFHSVIQTYSGDFSDSFLLNRIFDENNIDIVIHSLSTTVPVDSANARFDVESNLLPTLDVLECMVRHNVKDIVYISSGGAIYGTKGTVAHKEDDDVFPVSSYGVVKLAIEKYLMQYAQLYDIRPLILRLSNPYGPYHYSMKQGIVNVAIAKALNGKTLEIWGDGNDKKDYIYVEDFVDILFKLISKGVVNTVINVASGQLLSVNEIVDALKQTTSSFNVSYTDRQKFDASHFKLGTDKLKSVIGDFQFTKFEDGLLRTLDWTRTIC